MENGLYQAVISELTSFPALLTLKVCAACLAAHLLFSIPLAWYLGSSRKLTRKLVSFLVTIPLVFPPIALGFILLTILGRRSPIGQVMESFFGFRLVFSYPGLVLAAFVAGLPLLVRPLEAALRRDEIRGLTQAARTLGCGPFKAFILVTLPQVGPTAASGLILALARASGEVGISLMLGGNIIGRSNTLSLEIYNSVAYGDFDRAMILCAILAASGLIMYLALEIITPSEP
ncbi:MAG: ABC transporter permease subunit [Deltaproteobacteria bacterium]|jgi:molybdate transport system permease protein|nr:ABC transporter permease subunit [Deltaproteobacteria bacterium]